MSSTHTMLRGVISRESASVFGMGFSLVESLTWRRGYSHPGRAQQGFCLGAENVALDVVNPVRPYLACPVAGHFFVHVVDHVEFLLEDRAGLVVTTGLMAQHALEEPLPNDVGVGCVLTPGALERLVESARAKESSYVDAIIAVIAIGGSGSQADHGVPLWHCGCVEHAGQRGHLCRRSVFRGF